MAMSNDPYRKILGKVMLSILEANYRAKSTVYISDNAIKHLEHISRSKIPFNIVMTFWTKK